MRHLRNARAWFQRRPATVALAAVVAVAGPGYLRLEHALNEQSASDREQAALIARLDDALEQLDQQATDSAAIVAIAADTAKATEQVALDAAAAAAQAQAAIDLANAQRDEARVRGCEDQNETYSKINGILRLATAPREGQTRTPEQQAAIDEALKPLLIPLRDCSPEGIARFYEEGNR